MSTITHAKLDSGMHFTASTKSGHTVEMDSVEKVGGTDKAARPAELPFVGLAGCTGMDTISILRKMRQEPESFSVEIEGIDRTEEHPKRWVKIRVIFHVDGEVEPKKLAKAIDLSRTRYCGVSTNMKGAVEILYSYVLNGERVDMGEPEEEE